MIYKMLQMTDRFVRPKMRHCKTKIFQYLTVFLCFRQFIQSGKYRWLKLRVTVMSNHSNAKCSFFSNITINEPQGSLFIRLCRPNLKCSTGRLSVLTTTQSHFNQIV